jgi:hypothetical protein
MSDLDAPATKRDLLDFATKQDIRDLRHEFEKFTIKLDALNVKLDTYWVASDRVQRLAFGLLVTANIAIIATALTLMFRG